MISLLLEVSAWVNQASAFIENTWLQLLAICGGTTGVISLGIVGAKIIAPAVVSKINKKSGVLLGVKEVNEKIALIEEEIKKIDELMENLPTIMTNVVNSGIDTYQENKRKACEKLLKGVKEVETNVEEVKTELKPQNEAEIDIESHENEVVEEVIEKEEIKENKIVMGD